MKGHCDPNDIVTNEDGKFIENLVDFIERVETTAVSRG